MAATHQGPAPMPDARSSAWRARVRVGWGLIRRTVAAERRSLGFVVAVAFILVLLQQSVEFATGRELSFDLVQRTAHMWEDLCWTLLTALVMFMVIQPARRLGPSGGARRVAVIVIAIALATVVALTIQTLAMLPDFGLEEALQQLRPGVVQHALPAAFVVAVGEFHRREILSLEAMRAAEADRSRLEQETLQARLKTLEAQIEPHFLFNTLANVRRLYEVDPVAGDAMLERMTRYLEIALPSMRGERVTLGREATLIEAYLDLQKVRMGRRLAFRIDIAPALRLLEVPPMMLLTLVENAIKHGLAPQREGGQIDVGARLEGEALELEVADTGGGFGGNTSGGGTGLANIQVRLAAMFGGAAQLTLAAREPRGLTATIRMPAALGP
jgi:sensor histidine kinase YesM